MKSEAYPNKSLTKSHALWLSSLRRYVALIAIFNLVWEFAHMPLYTIWTEADAAAIVFAAVHCTGGDIIIATIAIIGSLFICGSGDWPQQSFQRVALVTIGLGIGYTVFSEWLNTEIRKSWAYSDLMPVLPWIGTGISPLLQWVVIPVAALYSVRKQIDRTS